MILRRIAAALIALCPLVAAAEDCSFPSKLSARRKATDGSLVVTLELEGSTFRYRTDDGKPVGEGQLTLQLREYDLLYTWSGEGIPGFAGGSVPREKLQRSGVRTFPVQRAAR